ncbi:hypothetical protein BDY19DRAFT_376420 [Irpex rosettiformis]|uniref:Uncharacterized protein n=1 Tax=Irpex rosettiformis TaxID=378272 RepID=A0ACB8TVT0_9APHY|nr:hypothetical protein BDY19DRAFT_376420 [Irpex rosettiformis]
MPSLSPYGGYTRKLVLAFDVGTTYSGIGYAILDPGEVPKVQGVTRFPGQENGDFKIPTVLWYTQEGNVRAAGAEACSSSMDLAAEDEDLIFVQWFKLHLRPEGMKHDAGFNSGTQPPILPKGKSVVDVFADFLKYLFDCTHQYITETHPNGSSLWSSVADQIEVVLSHPNGWEGAQQSQMRRAAIKAGIVPNTPVGHQRVHFVTEGEASLHYCLDSGLATEAVKSGSSVMIIDAGGGTVDLSSYHFLASSPLSVEEIAPPDCIFQGSTRVNVRAGDFLKAKLKNSKYGNDEDLKGMLDHFDKSAKPTFKDSAERSFIKFGSMRDKDPAVGIRNGQVVVEGHEVFGFFEPSILAIVDAVCKQKAASSRPISQALLVGGFAASPWLFARLKDLLQPIGLELSRPDNHTNKAVAEGAVSYYLGDVVSARVARITYGVEVVRIYDASDSEHYSRRHKLYSRPSGNMVLPDGYSPILNKGTRVRDKEELSHSFYKEASQPSALNKIFADITCYRGLAKDPQWTDEEPDYFSTLCTIQADTSRVTKHKQFGSDGVYYKQDFKVVLSCGQTELKAQISWMENGVEQRGPAKIVYDGDATAC